ncbi:MAG: hypothetical protein ABSF89_18310 [Acidimicrobiales bacterium]
MPVAAQATLPAAQEQAVGKRCLERLATKEARSAEYFAAVDSLRPSNARKLVCEACRRTVGFLALLPWEIGTVTMTLAPQRVSPRRRRGGALDLRYHSNPDGGWLLDGLTADASRGHLGIVSSPSGPWGDTWQRRWEIRCACGARPVVTNDTLISKYLQAVASGQNRVQV